MVRVPLRATRAEPFCPYTRVFRSTFGEVMPGDIEYKDVNGDGLIDALDKVPLTHSTYPLLMYGPGAEVSYKNLTLGILFKGNGRTSFLYVGHGGNGMGYMQFYEGTSCTLLTLAADPANRWIPLDYALEQRTEKRQ